MKNPFRLLTAVLLLCFIAFNVSVQAQKKAKRSEAESLEAELKELMKQLDEADPEERKMLEESGLLDMIKNLEKQMGQMKQSGQLEKVFEEAATMAMLNPNTIPEKPSSLAVPPTPAGKEQLKAYLQPFMRSAEAAIKPNHKAEIAKHLNQGAKTGEIALAYLTNKEMDKALYLLLNACLTDTEDYTSLNNLGAFLTISGYAHKSLPILQYVQKHYPQSPTLLNNLGQAWLSLGYLDKAEKLLKDALKENEENTEAAYSLALLAKNKGNLKLCAAYAAQCVKHCASPDAIALIMETDPYADVASLVRDRFKQHYKDPKITKHFKLPTAPTSYSEQESRKGDLLQFIQDLNVTYDHTAAIYDKMMAQWETDNLKYIQDMQKSSTQIKSEEDMKEHMDKFAPHPLLHLATIILSNLHNPLVPDSYVNRIKKEYEAKAQREKDLIASLNGIPDQISAIYKQMNSYDPPCDGEGEPAVCESHRQNICRLKTEWAKQHNKGRGENINQHIRNMEQLLNDRLEEEVFWTIISEYPKDPSARLYGVYRNYLSDLRQVAGDYFGMTDPSCETNTKEEINRKGKLRQYELDHCDFSWGFDVVVFKGKMDCSGMKMEGTIRGLTVGYGQSIDPVTWDVTGHSISTEVGVKKEFTKEKSIVKGELGGSVKTTVKFDNSLNITDVAVKGSAGVDVSGPIGSTGIDAGSVEVSLSGGFNSSGPSVSSPGSSFLRGD